MLPMISSTFKKEKTSKEMVKPVSEDAEADDLPHNLSTHVKKPYFAKRNDSIASSTPPCNLSRTQTYTVENEKKAQHTE